MRDFVRFPIAALASAGTERTIGQNFTAASKGIANLIEGYFCDRGEALRMHRIYFANDKRSSKLRRQLF